MDYYYFMEEAIKEGKKALLIKEVPIGCVIVYDGQIIGRGYNLRNSNKNALHHAEIIAINEACQFMNDWRLEECTIFVNIEPCPMCAGAILQARLPVLVFGAKNIKAGACGSVLNLLDQDGFNHQTTIISGIMEEESSALMKAFFKRLREEKKADVV